ncbi:hypothetical protein DL240_18745 [Lujinxingia litoralis]|uniref:EF-hand domain-containing protein n=1 Tax=Lujinxingia litoralis TaxID=2211119 RepID=A0A328C2Q2_9DELT|nr:hypothetical protein [Lujinxingia litoralis]RAL20071.1 hypothetical protein DL240_18745 [Lujinxingia litoralis]
MPTTLLRHRALSALLLLPLTAACGGDAGPDVDTPKGPGSLQVHIYGESFIEEGIPADEFSDGWSVSFERFEVTLNSLTIMGDTTEVGQSFDLSQASEGQGQQVTTLELDQGAFSGLDYQLGTLEVVGQAEKDGVTKTFAWTFELPTDYESCDSPFEIYPGETAAVELTIHGDHLFFDSLATGAEAPSLIFDHLAGADANDDGDITRAELEATGVGALDVGNYAIDDLWNWLDAQSMQVGHVNGEAHCH